jgi:hypothetical protein
VRLWESATGQLRAEYRGHAGPVHHLAFSPDGMTLASASAETTVLLWGLYGAAGPERFAAVDLEQNWAALAGDDAAAAFRAVGRFVRQGDRAVAFLATKLAPAAVDAEAVARWVADLGSPTAARREAATAVLARVGSPAAAALRRVVAKADAPAEQRRRAEELLGQWDSSPPAAERQTLRAVEVLAHVGTAAARAELARLGQGAEGAAVTVAARAALARLVPPSR